MSLRFRALRIVVSSLAFGAAIALLFHSAGLSPLDWVLRQSAWRGCLAVVLLYGGLLLLAYGPLRGYLERRRRGSADDADEIWLVAGLCFLFSFVSISILTVGGIRPAPQVQWTLILCLDLALIWATTATRKAFQIDRIGLTLRTGPRALEADLPIETDEEDVLGRTVFVDRLSDQILTHRPEHPFVVAVVASWGEGKTSVLNLLARRIQAAGQRVMFFNPWYFPTTESLLQGFYAGLRQRLGDHRSSGLQSLVGRYGVLLTFGLPGTRLSIRPSVGMDPDSLRGRISQEIKRTESRLLIIIDDLDRVPIEQLMTMMQLVGLAAKFPRLTFILAFDPKVVACRLKSAGEDPTFLEKVIQHSVHLPAIEQSSLDQFLFPISTSGSRSRLDRVLEEAGINQKQRAEFAEKSYPFYVEHIQPLLTTLRRVKRFLNGIRTTLPPVAGNVNVHDYFLLEILRLFYPDVYDDILTNPWYYCPEQGAAGSLVSPLSLLEPTQRQDLIRKHVDQVLQPHKEARSLRGIIEELSVRVRAAYGGSGAFGATEELTEEDLRERRFTHPQNFPRYFLQRLPVGELSDNYVREMIGDWEDNRSQAYSRVRSTIQSHQVSGFAGELLIKLRVFRTEIGQETLGEVIRGIGAESGSLSREGHMWETEYDRGRALVLYLLNQLEEGKIAATVERLIEESTDPQLVIDIVLGVDRERGGSLWKVYQAVELSRVREAARSRIRELLVTSDRDVFESESMPEYVLFQWATTLRDKDGVGDYLSRLADRRPECLGRFLSKFLVGSADGEHRFRLSHFSKGFDLEFVERLCERSGAEHAGTSAERNAVKVFVRSVNDMQEGNATEESVT